MLDVLLVRYGEVFLKGANRPHFLKVLTDNIKRAVKPIGGHVWLSDSRIYVSDFEDLQECIRRVTKVFGVYSVSPAVEMEKDFDVIVTKRYLNEGDHVLIIDDFLANGCALRGLIEICEEAGAQVTGIGIAIEKGFQPGGRELREDGYDLDSLAIVTSMNHETGEIVFA